MSVLWQGLDVLQKMQAVVWLARFVLCVLMLRYFACAIAWLKYDNLTFLFLARFLIALDSKNFKNLKGRHCLGLKCNINVFENLARWQREKN